MFRKSREDKSEWTLPTLFMIVGDYGPFRTKGYDPIGNTLRVVWFHDSWPKEEEGMMMKDGIQCIHLQAEYRRN